MIRGFTRYTAYSLEQGKPSRRHYVEFWEQPLYRWVVAKVYHWYDTRIYRVPGFKLVERMLWDWYRRRHEDDLLYVPLSARQDIRCYHLGQKRRVTLTTVEVNAEQWEKMKD